MTGRDIVCLLHNCVVLSFCSKTQDTPSVIPDWWLPQSPSDARTAFPQHPTRPHKGMGQPLHLPFPSHLLMTRLLLLKGSGKLAPLWFSLINTHVHTDLIYFSLFVLPELGRGVVCK
ncbi:hypothetical protein Nmel_002657 [Mimus melanotis]